MKLVGQLIVVLVILAIHVEGHKKHKKHPQCPKGMPPTGVKYCPAEIAKLRKETTANLWSHPKSTPLSKDAQLLRDELIKMSNSPDEEQQILSTGATLWTYMYINTADTASPDLCPFAQVINATSEWAETGSCSEMSEPLKKIVYQIQYRTIVVFCEALANTGCGKMITDCKGRPKIVPMNSRDKGTSPVKTFVKKEECYRNGFAYDIDDMLAYIGDGYSDEARCILRRLYHSCDPQDNLIALITLATASAPVMTATENYRNEMKYTFFKLGCQGKLPQCCCEKFRKDLTRIYEESLDENTRIYNATMTEYC